MQERLTKFVAVLGSSDSSICIDLCNKNCSDGHSKRPKTDFRMEKVSLETLQNTYIFLLNVNFENLIIRLHDKYVKLTYQINDKYGKLAFFYY